MVINIQSKDIKEIKPKKSKKRLLIILLIFILIIGVGAFLGRSYIFAIKNILSDTHNVIPTNKDEKNTVYKYNGGKKIVNVLLLGSDDDSKFKADSVLTQTMIIVSINTDTKVVNMVSIPRDSWVKFSSGGIGKIDEASGGGRGLGAARATVEKNYGVKIDYYAWIGLKGFEKGIDTLGGIDIDVTHPILDEEYPNDTTGLHPNNAIRLYIPAGAQHLTGETALRYVRSRHGDLQGDFGRSFRQQQVLLKVKDKLTTDIMSKIPDLVEEMKDSAKTDMSISEIIQFAPLLFEIKSSSINRYILDPPDYGKLDMINGKDVVVPDFNKIDKLFTKLFNTNG